MSPTHSWPEVLSALSERHDLDAATAAWAMDEVMSGAASPAQVSAFLVLLRAKGETVAELGGLADVLLAHARPLPVAQRVLDIVGTGGDRANTVNISTMSAIVAAGAGVPVVKHGNRAASSQTGTADVIEALGVNLRVSPERAAQLVDEVGLTFVFAQAFHPSMANAAPIRRELGIPTTFNFLGPLINPARPAYSLIGCARADMAPLMAGVLAARGAQAAVVRGRDGLDEATVADASDVWWVRQGRVEQAVIAPEDVGLGRHRLDSLRGGEPAHNATVVERLLAAESGPVRDAVLLNTGLALAVCADDSSAAGLHESVAQGVARAAEAIDSGAAAGVLERWRVASQR